MILIFGICGILRCEEIVNITITDVEDLNDKYLIYIQDTKNNYDTGTISASRKFIVGPLFYNIVKKYISLRPTDLDTLRFFIRYEKGKCIRQVIGLNKIYSVPGAIADHLKIPPIQLNKVFLGIHCEGQEHHF